MSDTTPDPADVHTGTDRVELTDAEYDQLSDALKLEPPTPDAPMYYVGGIDDVVASIVAARVQALTAERDERDRQAVAEHDRAEGWRKKQVEAVGEVRRLLGVTNEYDDCKPTCRTFGSHAFNCPNHPAANPQPRHCRTCTCPERKP